MTIRRCPRRIPEFVRAATIAIALPLAGCGGDDPPSAAAPKGPPPYDELSTYGFFKGPLVNQEPAEGVLPYDVSAPLWSDGALKTRFFALPKGGLVDYKDQDDWGFPTGTAIVKTFAFAADRRDAESPAHIYETRVLLLEEKGWTGHVYIWNEAQTEATRFVAGKRVNVDYIDEDGVAKTEEYIIPNTNQCKSCHARDDEMHELGITTPMMNREVTAAGATRNQLDWLAEKGVFKAPPPASSAAAAFPDPFGAGPLNDRARAYLSSNCSHCHRPGGGGGDSGLVFLPSAMEPAEFGVCKSPAAAGSGTGDHTFDIEPGAPESSIVIFRMSSTDPELKMPELPNRVPDAKGIALISEWITAMEPKGCQ